MRAPEPQLPSLSRAISTLAILLAAYIISFIDRQILSLMVIPIRADLGISDFQISLLQGFAFALLFCLVGLPMGWLADRVSRKYLIAAGIAFWSLMTVLSGFAGTFLALFICRMGVGIGEATLAPAGYSMLGDSFPPDKIIWATSVFGQGATLGAGLSLLLGGQIVEYTANLRDVPQFLAGLQPWQLAFVAVGLPGFLVAAALLFVREPARQGLVEAPAVRFSSIFELIWKRRRTYAPFYICGGLLSVVNFSAMTWFPTHLMRVFHFTPGETGLALGTIHLIGAVVGASLGATLTTWMLRRGHTDAYLRTVLIVSVLIAATMVAPLIMSLQVSLAVWLVSVILQCAYAGSIYAALYLITPGRMRAVITATLILVGNLVGLAAGAAAIGGLASVAFHDEPTAIGTSLAIVCSSCALVSALVAYRALPQFRAVLEQASLLRNQA